MMSIACLERPLSSRLSWSVMKTFYNASPRQFHQTVIVNKFKENDRRYMIQTAPKKDEGVSGAKAAEIDHFGYKTVCEFPDIDTPNRLFNGVPFSQVPIVIVRVSKNNTIMYLTDPERTEKPLIRSCGREGFKNCRKGTTVAAQATGVGMGRRLLDMGVNQVRLAVRGLGPGRMASVKGLESTGVKIICISDETPIWEPPIKRPPLPKSI